MLNMIMRYSAPHLSRHIPQILSEQAKLQLLYISLVNVLSHVGVVATTFQPSATD